MTPILAGGKKDGFKYGRSKIDGSNAFQGNPNGFKSRGGGGNRLKLTILKKYPIGLDIVNPWVK